jgi:hypothetical protein
MPGRPTPSWPSAQLTIHCSHSAVMVGVRNARAGARLGGNPSVVFRLGDVLRRRGVRQAPAGRLRAFTHDADGERGVIDAGRV